MAALDFPNAPSIGNTYTGPNGAVYTWDGAAWTVSGVLSTGTTAGGDLTGTYPSPTIAALAVTRAKLAAGAPIGNFVTAAVTGYSTTTVGSWQQVTALASLTVRGGLVFLLAPHGLFYTNAAATANDVWLKFVRSGTDVGVVTWRIGHAGTIPVPPHFFIDVPPAGTYTYTLQILPTGSGTSITSNTGSLGAYEVS